MKKLVHCPDLLHITGMSPGNMGVNFSNPTSENAGTRVHSSAAGSDILDRTTHDLKLEKSNILMLGPTGSGKNEIKNLISYTSLA